MWRSMWVAVAFGLWGVVVQAASVEGVYVEARNAAMWAGPCLTNSEMGVAGDKATLAWKIQKGSLDGVVLDDLSIVALVFGEGTFGMGQPVSTRTILIIDARASKQQEHALIRLAHTLAPETIQKIIDVRRAQITVDVDPQRASSFIDADIATVRTRQLRRSDSLCGTDQHRMVYPTLARVSNEQPAYALENSFNVGLSGLNIRTFEDRNAPSAVIGHFAL